MRLSCRYVEIREAAGKTAREIATAAGINSGDLSRIERGLQLPADDLIERLEAAYGVPLTEIYTRAGLLAIQDDEPKRILVTAPRPAA